MTLSIAVLPPSRASSDTAVATAKASPAATASIVRRYVECLGAIKVRASAGRSPMVEALRREHLAWAVAWTGPERARDLRPKP
jgi:hypothetical protein